MKSSLLTILMVTLPAVAQTTVKDALIKHWKTSGEFTIAVARSMPAESYNFRPHLEEMTFGQLMRHIAAVNLQGCAYASGMTLPTLPPKIAELAKDKGDVDIEKATAIEFLNDSFAFCNKAVASMSPDRINTVVGPPASHLTGFEWLWSDFTHTAHHRGQAQIYLRVKGVKPPDYTF
ncbi:MAG TPA: DinB family protein [Bryobacteraceae bacterium]|jgi:hypothetical protein